MVVILKEKEEFGGGDLKLKKEERMLMMMLLERGHGVSSQWRWPPTWVRWRWRHQDELDGGDRRRVMEEKERLESERK